MDYTFHQLRIFETVARLGSVTKASEELYLTQPAVSIQLKKLQDQFEIPLTEIIGRQLHVTDFGYNVLEVCKHILEESERLETITKEYKGLLTGKLRFSVVSTAKYVIPFFIKEFTELYPGVEISIDVTNKHSVLKSMEENTSDFGMVSLLPDKHEFKHVTLMENRMLLVGGADNENQGVSREVDLSAVPLIFREQGSATRYLMEDYLDQHNVQVKKRLELVSNEAIKQAMMAGLGYSILPAIGIRSELESGSLQVYKATDIPFSTQWNIIFNKNKLLSPAANRYLEFLNEQREHIIETYFGWLEKVL